MWGQSALSEPEGSGLTVHMQATQLLKTIMQAFRSRKAVYKGLMLVVPIFHPSTGAIILSARLLEQCCVGVKVKSRKYSCIRMQTYTYTRKHTHMRARIYPCEASTCFGYNRH